MDKTTRNTIKINKIFGKILSEWHYAKFVKTVDEAIKSKQPLKVVITDQEVLSKIIIPHTVMEIQKNITIGLDNLISSILAAFDIEYRFGTTPKNKALIKMINDYPGMTKDEKDKLICYLMLNLKYHGGL